MAKPHRRTKRSTPAPSGPRRRAPGRGGPGEPGRRAPAPPPRGPLRIDRLLLGLVLLAAALRFWGITDRLPDPTVGINVLEDTAIEETDRTTMGRSWSMWKGGTKPLDLNPQTSGWPSLSFYATLGIQYLYRFLYGFAHPNATAADFAVGVVNGAEARPMFLLARVLDALVGIATVALTYRLGLRVVGRWAAFGGALLLAVNLPHILVSQHVSDPNLLALLFVLLAAFPLVRIASRRGTTRDSLLAGAMIGLAGACKYVPLVLVVPLLLAHPRGLRDRRLWLGAAAVAVALFAATPFTFLDAETTLRDLSAQRRSLFSSWIGQSDFPISLPTYLLFTLPRAMGWPAYLLAIVGSVLLWRRGPATRLLIGTAVLVVFVNGLLKAAQERYVLIAVPFLCLAASVAFEAGLRAWKSRAPAIVGAPARSPAGIAVPVLVAALTVAWPLPELARIRATLSVPDTRHVARKWIQARVPRDMPMAVELYGPVFAEAERLFVVWPFFATQAPLVRPAYHPEFLDGLRVIAQSAGISGRFEADSAHYPVEVAYYRWLRENARLLWSSREEKASGPAIEVRELPPSISTRAERDSLFRSLLPRPTGTTRLALWCHDMAVLLGRAGAYERSEEWARRGLTIGSRTMNPQLYGVLSLARLRQNDPAGAEEAARAAVALAPRSSAAHLYRGTALHDLGRREEALEELRAALMLSGDDRIRLNLGELLAEMERYDEAAAQLEAVPRGIVERAAARRDLAILYLNFMGRRAEGIEALKEAAALEPDPREAQMLRAEVARLTGSSPGR